MSWVGKGIVTLLAIAVAATISLAGLTPASAQLADSPWPMFRHDPQHTGRSTYTGPEAPVEKWSFTDCSTGEIDSWLWDFGDGMTSQQQSPWHMYSHAGVYTVSLTVSGPEGEDTETKIGYITIEPARPR